MGKRKEGDGAESNHLVERQQQRKWLRNPPSSCPREEWLSWSRDFFRTSDISKQACLHSTQLPRQRGRKTKVFSTSDDKEVSLGVLLRHQMGCFPCRWSGSCKRDLGRSWCLKDRSLEGSHTSDCHGSTGQQCLSPSRGTQEGDLDL